LGSIPIGLVVADDASGPDGDFLQCADHPLELRVVQAQIFFQQILNPCCDGYIPANRGKVSLVFIAA